MFLKNGDPYVQAPGTLLKESHPVGHPNQWGLKNHTRLHPLTEPKKCLKNYNARAWVVDILPYEIFEYVL